MGSIHDNVKLNYLYRDAGNYKVYGQIIFKQKSKITIQEIEHVIKSHLIDGEYFDPLQWKIPLIYSHSYNPETDHDWYEFEEISHTANPETENTFIEDFLEFISTKTNI